MKELTFVFSARNDNYMGNFLFRLTSAINFLARNLEKVDRLDRVEFLVADWNSEVPLQQAIQLTPAAAAVTRFARVPPALAASVQNADQVFHFARSFNAVIRRAEGRYIMMLDSDALVPLHSVRALFDVLEGRSGLPLDPVQAFFVADRRHVPWEIVQSEPTLEGWNDYLVIHGGELPVDVGMPGLGICQGGWLAHRDIWHGCQGYDERLGYWGWIDAELILRTSQKYPWVQLSGVGVQVFHMEHWPRNRRASSPMKSNPHVISQSFAVNDANWGLGDKPVETSPAGPSRQLPASNLQLVPDKRDEVKLLSPQHFLAGLAKAPRDSVIRDLIRGVTKTYRGLKLERCAFEMLAALCQRHCPRVYVEYGASVGRCSTSIVVHFSPGLDVYAIDDWKEKDERAGSPACFSTALNKMQFRGYTRFLSGDMRTALSRLKQSSFGPLTVDLAMFRERLFPGDAVGRLTELLPCLAPLGAVVCVSDKPDFWQKAEQAIQQNHPQLVLMKPDRVTALIVSRQVLSPAAQTGP